MIARRKNFKTLPKSKDLNLSARIGGRTAVMDCFRDDLILFLYENNIRKQSLFESLLKKGLENNELCLYASPHAASLESAFKIYIDRHQLHLFSLTRCEELASLGLSLENLCQKVASSSEYIAIRVFIDFSEIGKDSQTEDRILKIETEISARKKTSFPISGVIAFDIDSLNPAIVKKLIWNVQLVILSTEKETTIAFEIPLSGERHRGIELFSSEIMEKFVKKSFEPIMLSLLREGPISGYDLIKKIYNSFNVLLPQGTVYSFLYMLKSGGILEVSSRGNEKQYFLTEAGKNYIDNELNGYATAYSNLLAMINS